MRNFIFVVSALTSANKGRRAAGADGRQIREATR
jgi:hypothetical protein